MSDKKNIDQLFQDSFKDFEASPDPALWDKISDKLDAKEAEKDEKGIVFLPWLYKAAGIAAAIVLFFFIGNEFLNSDGTGIGTDEKVTTTTKDGSLDKDANGNTTNSQVTDRNTNSEQNSANDQQNSSSDNLLQDKERIANENTNGLDSDGNQLQNGNNSAVQEGNALQNTVVNQDGTNSNSNSNSQQSSNNRLQTNSIQNNNTVNQENAVANSNSTQNNNSNASNGTTTNTSQNTVNGIDRFTNTVAQNTNNTLNNTNATTNGVQNGVNGAETNSNTVINSNSTAVAQNENTTNSSGTNATTNTGATTNTDTTTSETAVAEVQKDGPIKKSLLDEINDLYDLEKDNTDIAESTLKRWSISPNASPVYYNTLSNGSPIDETFADNSKTGDVNFSYGVNVGYDVNKRLTVRSGIHKVDYSYSTRDIALVPSIDGTDLTTIQFRGNNNSFDIKDRQAASNVAFSQYQLPSTESSIREKQIEGNLNQRMSYIEVPVELKYALVDKKLGVNVIGGVSTLLLTENSIVLDSPEILTEIGEATNVNDVSFSTNIGLGIDYKVSKQIEVNVEPMLKYQLNTFSGNTGNFKPYSVGVYTGVSFRF